MYCRCAEISEIRKSSLKFGCSQICPGFRKPRFLKKAQPIGFFGALLGFWISLFEKLVGWFSSSAKLLFRFAITVGYRKVRTFITYWSLNAVNIKKSLIITGMTNWNWIKVDAGFCCFFNGSYQGSHTSLKVLEFFSSIFNALKVLENRVGAWNSLNLSFKVVESPGIFLAVYRFM